MFRRLRRRGVRSRRQNQQEPKLKPHKPVPRRPSKLPRTACGDRRREKWRHLSRPTIPRRSLADVPRAAVQSQRENTENLLRKSEGKLGHISRTLGEGEEGMLRQARNYIAQSNQALQAGDIERAYNLAVKASLLANELTK